MLSTSSNSPETRNVKLSPTSSRKEEKRLNQTAVTCVLALTKKKSNLQKIFTVDNLHWAFSPESKARLAPKIDLICTFGRCVVLDTNRYFYIFEKQYAEAVNYKASLEVDLINVKLL